MNSMRLLKLLYIADREALAETGRPITGGPVVAMERGPVLEEVYDLIKGQHRQMPLWGAFIRQDRYDVELLQEPDVGQLSRYEIRKLQTTAKAYQDLDEWALSKLTHDFPEWQKNNPGTSCRPIPLQDMLEALGQEVDTQKIIGEAHSRAIVQRILGR